MLAAESMRQLCRLREGKLERGLRDCVRARDALRECLAQEEAALHRVDIARQACADSRALWRDAILGQQTFAADRRHDHLRALARLDHAWMQAGSALAECVAGRQQAQAALEAARAALARLRTELEQARLGFERLQQQRRVDALVREEGEQDESALLRRGGRLLGCVA